ncbi:peptide chain release factor N(5)-glutamine methyltransferase [uncultured Halopseudomonas sp.]|uniref:peptide chain release factor N(5)-glutamine methyltransferase n=1 Tax=uncultured Halopseudomonas sp. TaxID=2901193 RepID=UPI0030EBA527|tara:strand:- start:122605 stop:123435 length:831 start_codon:yes stop_codon:yes gene_type:complete
MQTLAQLLADADLPDSPTAALDAELILAHVLRKPRSFLHTWPEYVLDPQRLELFQGLIERRRAGEPVAYLLGAQGFWSLDLQVSDATLIPRPDTERLVELALELGPLGRARVLDMGTGTGAVALALASERRYWSIMATDLVPAAVELAEVNRKRLGLENVQLKTSDWFAALEHESFDLVVSNPPYISADDPHLRCGDVRYEPATALVSGADGLDAIRHIVSQAPDYLHTDGWLLLEHGWQQADAVVALLVDRGFQLTRSWQDLGGQYRISGGQWRG